MQHIDNRRLTRFHYHNSLWIYRELICHRLFSRIKTNSQDDRIPVITSAELCGAFGKEERERRRLRDYDGGNIPPLPPLLCEDGPLSFLSLISFFVNSSSPCLCPQGPYSGSLTLLQPLQRKRHPLKFSETNLQIYCLE